MAFDRLPFCSAAANDGFDANALKCGLLASALNAEALRANADAEVPLEVTRTIARNNRL